MMGDFGKRIFTTVISLIIIPLFLFAQQAEKLNYEEVCERAKMKAQENVSGEVYFVASVFLGPIGVWLAYASEIPQPPIEEILNKPSDYLIVYKQCYSQEAKRIQMRKAWDGFAIGILFDIFLLNVFCIHLTGQPIWR